MSYGNEYWYDYCEICKTKGQKPTNEAFNEWLKLNASCPMEYEMAKRIHLAQIENVIR